MRAVTQSEYGDSSVLDVETVARPVAGPKEVLIEVRSAALDRGTEHLMTGLPMLIRIVGYGLTRPKQPIPGLDVAGVVVEVGSAVERFVPGDEVFGIADGSLAEFAVAEEAKLSHKPESITFDEAAASAVSGITALQGLTDVGRVESGDRVLVVGASGGVGSFAVQIARALGATVDGVAGARNIEFVKSLGADQVFDYATTPLDDLDEDYDLVIDIGGRNSVASLRRRLTKKGTLVFVGGEGGNRITGGIGRSIAGVMMSPFVSQRIAGYMSTEHHSFVDRLAVMLEAGTVAPAIGRRFPLGETRDAMRQLESGLARGKTVIRVSDER